MLSTILPQNLTVARFYFKTLFDSATTQGQLDFKGSVYRDLHANVYAASIMSLLTELEYNV